MNVSSPTQRPRVAVTAFYAAWRVGTGWREIRSSPPRPIAENAAPIATGLSLRALCEHVGGVIPASSLPPKNYRPQPDALRSRLRDELAGAGLWDRNARRLNVDAERVSLSFSSSKGFWPQRLEEKYFDVVDWLCCDGAARMMSRAIGARGRLASPVAACATGAHAIALGAQWIEDGYADVVIAGAVERPIEPLLRAGYENLGALSKAGVMRPFDRRRDGFVPNDGMALVVLENVRNAVGRGAAIHGYLSGFEMSADASSLLEMESDGSSITRAVEKVARASGRDAVDYINAHGTATRLNDAIEARGIAQSCAARNAAISSTKPLTGHLLGAAGAVEAAICLQALREGFVPPTLNLDQVDCDLDCVPHIGRVQKLESALSLSYGFGGHIGALLFEKN